MTVLTMARGEAQHYLPARTLLPEATRLAGAESLTQADRAAREAVPHNAISHHATLHHPAATAAAVERLLPADTSEQQTAALVWYHTPLCRGANAP
jgi:hypothetical protein